MRRWIGLALACSSLLWTGCGEQPSGDMKDAAAPAAGSGGSGVAVLDLRTVGQRLGRDKQISAAIQQRNAQLRSQLEALTKDLGKQFSAKKKAIGDKPTEAQKKELFEMDQKFKTQMAKARSQASRALSDFRLQVNRQFQNEVRPVAMKIAREMGASVVLLHDPNQTGFVFAREDSVDITKPVVLTLLQKDMQAPAPDSGKVPPKAPPKTSQTPGPTVPQFTVPKIEDPTVPKKPEPKK